MNEEATLHPTTLAAPGIKFQEDANVFSGQVGDAGLNPLVRPNAIRGKRLVKNDDKIISIIIRDGAAIVARHADNFVFRGDDLHGNRICHS